MFHVAEVNKNAVCKTSIERDLIKIWLLRVVAFRFGGVFFFFFFFFLSYFVDLSVPFSNIII